MSNEITAFKAMQTDIQVSMDDVVSAFVSQYESNLYARKKELGAAVKDVNNRIDVFMKALRKKINGDSFVNVAMPFDLAAISSEGQIDWDKATMHFQISINRKGTENRSYGSTINVSKYKPIPAAQVKAHERLEKEASGLRADLSDVLVALKSITRKEREVRGRIAVRKLEDSGYANLMQDSELVKLVQLDL